MHVAWLAAVGGRLGQCQDGQQELRRSARNCLGRPPGSHAEGESSRTVAGSAHAVVGEPSQYLPAGDAPLVALVGDVLGGELTVGHAPVATVAVRARHGGCPVRGGYVAGSRVSSNAAGPTLRPRRGRRAARCGWCQRGWHRRSHPRQSGGGVDDDVAYHTNGVSVGILDGDHAYTRSSAVIPVVAHIVQICTTRRAVLG